MANIDLQLIRIYNHLGYKLLGISLEEFLSAFNEIGRYNLNVNGAISQAGVRIASSIGWSVYGAITLAGVWIATSTGWNKKEKVS